MTYPHRRQSSATWSVGKAGSKYGDEDALLHPGFASNLRQSVSRPSSTPHTSSWIPSKQCVTFKTISCPTLKGINKMDDNQRASYDNDRELEQRCSGSHPHPHLWALPLRSNRCTSGSREANRKSCSANSDSNSYTPGYDDNAHYLSRDRRICDGNQNKNKNEILSRRRHGWGDGDEDGDGDGRSVNADSLSFSLSAIKRNNQTHLQPHLHIHPADIASASASRTYSKSKWCHSSPTREKGSFTKDITCRNEKEEEEGVDEASLLNESTCSTRRQHTSEDAAVELLDKSMSRPVSAFSSSSTAFRALCFVIFIQTNKQRLIDRWIDR